MPRIIAKLGAWAVLSCASLALGDLAATTAPAADRIAVAPSWHAASLPVVIRVRLTLAAPLDIGVTGPTDAPNANAYDILISGGKWSEKRIPLVNFKEGQGLITPLRRPAGATIEFDAYVGRLEAGNYSAEIVNREMDTAAVEADWFAKRPIAPPVVGDSFRIGVSADDTMRMQTLSRLRGRLDAADPFFGALAWAADVPEMHQHLLLLLRDPSRSECGYAARMFRRYGWVKLPAEFDATLLASVSAAKALPMDARNDDVLAALMHLVQSYPRPELLDAVIRCTKPDNAVYTRDSAQMALQAYRDEPRAIEAMAAMLDDPSLATTAARYLCEWRRDERAIAVFERHAFGTDGRTSQPAVYFGYLWRYGRHPRVLAAIEKGLKDDREDVRTAAQLTLDRIDLAPTTKPAN